ncbi:ACT domain-containing protein [Jonesiaceae bacterium BS-20]|uniref:ACT domain-containing protein n=1 Tax=Jonesiaceae bacterium BS-20 TaxID=3120821 RepID=A0AAU7DZN8_9MICO
MTTGSTDLAQMLATLEATARPDTYVYTVVEPDHPVLVVAQVTVQEERGLTAVIRKQDAQTHNLDYEFECAWLTLTVHSSLEAVGLTAAFSAALGNAGISCNVIAGFYHDHLLVPVADKDRALAVLAELRISSTV